MRKTGTLAMMVLLVGAGMTIAPGVDASPTYSNTCELFPMGTGFTTGKRVTKPAFNDGCPWLEDGPVEAGTDLYFHNDRSDISASVQVYRVAGVGLPLELVYSDGCVAPGDYASNKIFPLSRPWKMAPGLYHLAIAPGCPIGAGASYQDDVLIAWKLVTVLVAPEPNPVVPDPLLDLEPLPWVCQSIGLRGGATTYCIGNPPWYPGNCAGVGSSSSAGKWNYTMQCLPTNNNPTACSGNYDANTGQFDEDCTEIRHSPTGVCVTQWNHQGAFTFSGSQATGKSGSPVLTMQQCAP